MLLKRMKKTIPSSLGMDVFIKTTLILNVSNKQTVMLVQKCLGGIVVPSFKKYFDFRDHRREYYKQ